MNITIPPPSCPGRAHHGVWPYWNFQAGGSQAGALTSKSSGAKLRPPAVSSSCARPRNVCGPKRGGTTLALGGGLWAGGQQEPDGQGGKPWLHRVDLGPRAMLTVPVERGALTFALDWRQRMDGQARPSSGVALTLSAGF